MLAASGPALRLRGLQFLKKTSPVAGIPQKALPPFASPDAGLPPASELPGPDTP